MADLGKLFCYDPGDGTVQYRDPTAIHNALTLAFSEQGQTEENALTLCASENPVQKAQGGAMVEIAARKVFDLIPFNGRTGEGCSYTHACEVYRQFFDWSTQKKTSSAPTPTSPTATGLASLDCPPT